MLKKLSPAKVNLHLRVLRKREDGYHDIATLMQPISLYDEMIFCPAENGITIQCPGSSVPENENNIVFRAAAALFSQASCSSGIHITIHKRIPVAAGLGGGSSNAATALTTINDLMGIHYTRENLMKIGANIGADIPFFILGKSAWAFGIGDQLHTVDYIPLLWFVLINPGFEISTKMIYENFNLRLTKQAVKYKCPALYTIEDLIKGLYNDLEKVTLGLHPELQHIENHLIQNGALGALMSGSGPTVAGIFTEEKEALKAKEAIERIREKEWSVFVAHSL
jgi:4-diphosphocytidyl-2-C-methyl-D-erythritol kinase